MREAHSDGLGRRGGGGGGKVGEERLVGTGGGGVVGRGRRVVGVVAGVEGAVHGAAAGLQAWLAGHLDGDPAQHHRRDRDHSRHHRTHPLSAQAPRGSDASTGGGRNEAKSQSQLRRDKTDVVWGPLGSEVGSAIGRIRPGRLCLARPWQLLSARFGMEKSTPGFEQATFSWALAKYGPHGPEQIRRSNFFD